MPKRKKKVLVYRTGHLGDTVCAIPAFRLLRRFFAHAELTLLCDRPRGAKVASADVIRPLGLFDNIRTYTSNRRFPTLWELARSVCSINPDILIVLPQVSESIESVRRKITFFRRCGVRDVRGHNFPALRHAWQPTESNRLIQILRSIGVRGEKPGFDIPMNTVARESVRDKFAKMEVDPNRPFLIFCGGGKDATQRWPLERYARVLPVMAGKLNWPMVAVGNRAEMEGYRRCILPEFPGLKLFSDPISLEELFEVCRMAAAFFGNDCGPMHVAASVNCPVAVLMSARALPGAWSPNVTPSHVIRLRIVCEGCLLRECVEEKHRCMVDISEERVLAEVIPFLNRLPSSRLVTSENI